MLNKSIISLIVTLILMVTFVYGNTINFYIATNSSPNGEENPISRSIFSYLQTNVAVHGITFVKDAGAQFVSNAREAAETAGKSGSCKSLLCDAREFSFDSNKKLKSYFITVDLIDVASYKVEKSFHAGAKNEDYASTAALEIGRYIRQYLVDTYSHKSLCSEEPKPPRSPKTENKISFITGMVQPSGAFADLVGNGQAIQASYTLDNLHVEKFSVKVSAGIHRYEGNAESTQSIISIPVFVSAGWDFALYDRLSCVPYLGAGYMINRMTYHPHGKSPSGAYEYQSRYYYDPMITVGVEFFYPLYNHFSLLATPSYTMFFEQGNTGRVVGIMAGVSYSL